MVIYFECPHCREQLKALEGLAGRTGVCTKCKKKLIIPVNRSARAPGKGTKSKYKRAKGESEAEDEIAKLDGEIEKVIQKKETEIEQEKIERRTKSGEGCEVISQKVFVELVKEVDQEIEANVKSKENEMRNTKKNDNTVLKDAVFIGAEPTTVQKLINSTIRSNPNALDSSAGTARIKRHRTVTGANGISRRSKIQKDDDLIKLVKEAFNADERVSLEPIDVSAINGTVTLSGSVRTHRRGLAAQEIASSFEGCLNAVNRLTVDPETPLSDTEVAKNVKCSLDASADITADVVNATATNGFVSLSGPVRSPWERLVAEDVARSVRGVRDVENLLVIDLA
jgi:osmotically-inducible protein OsmY